jgi:hypothetical protein
LKRSSREYGKGTTFSPGTSKASRVEIEAKLSTCIDTILRYETTLKRDLYRAIEALERVQERKRAQSKQTIPKKGVASEGSDGIDFSQAVVGSAYASVAALDKHWKRRVEALPQPNGLARVYCSPHLDQMVQDIERQLGLLAEPILTRVYKWNAAMAQYTVGHLERLERIQHFSQGLPALALAGNGYRGIGVPDCVRSGVEAATALTGNYSRACLGIAARSESPFTSAGPFHRTTSCCT